MLEPSWSSSCVASTSRSTMDAFTVAWIATDRRSSEAPIVICELSSSFSLSPSLQPRRCQRVSVEKPVRSRTRDSRLRYNIVIFPLSKDVSISEGQTGQHTYGLFVHVFSWATRHCKSSLHRSWLRAREHPRSDQLASWITNPVRRFAWLELSSSSNSSIKCVKDEASSSSTSDDLFGDSGCHPVSARGFEDSYLEVLKKNLTLRTISYRLMMEKSGPDEIQEVVAPSFEDNEDLAALVQQYFESIISPSGSLKTEGFPKYDSFCSSPCGQICCRRGSNGGTLTHDSSSLSPPSSCVSDPSRTTETGSLKPACFRDDECKDGMKLPHDGEGGDDAPLDDGPLIERKNFS